MDAAPKKNGLMRTGIACNIKTDHSSEQQAEFDEPETIEAISNALEKAGFETVILEASESFPHKLETEKPDIVFNIAEGKTGRNREAQVPAILEYYGIPYTGSDAAALSVSLDKALTKQIARSCGVLTPDFFMTENGASDLPDSTVFPVLIKPNAEGSSKGISDNCVASDSAEFEALVSEMSRYYGQQLLAEQYIDGREFTVGIIGNGSDIKVFEPMEIIYRKRRGPYNIYSYEVKQNFREYISYQCPPQLEEKLKNQMMNDAKTVYEILRCADFARADFRLSADGKVYFIEINPLPGLAPGYSDFIISAQFNGIEYDSLISEILNHALKRLEMKAEI